MAKYKSAPKLFIALIIVGILLLVGTTLFALSQNSTLQEHAALPTYTSLAIKGNIFLDTNKNGVKDPGEVNYTSTPLPKVKVSLVSQVCPTISPEPSIGVTPGTTIVPSTTPPAHCYYRTMCPMIACRDGKCPTCAPTLICVTPGTGEGGGTVGTGSVTGSPIQVIQGQSVKAAETGPNSQGVANQGNNGNQSDVCREFPQQVIDCTVSADGTYLCSGQNVTPFTSAFVSIVVPSNYWTVTSKNPVEISGNTGSVDFGLAPSGIVVGGGPNPQGITSGTKQAFTIHVDGAVAGLPVVMYVSEGKENPDPAVSGVFTTDSSGNITVKVTPNDQLIIVPVTSKGYSSVTPTRLQVTVSKNSCGLDTPCIFTATPQK